VVAVSLGSPFLDKVRSAELPKGAEKLWATAPSPKATGRPEEQKGKQAG